MVFINFRNYGIYSDPSLLSIQILIILSLIKSFIHVQRFAKLLGTLSYIISLLSLSYNWFYSIRPSLVIHTSTERHRFFSNIKPHNFWMSWAIFYSHKKHLVPNTDSNVPKQSNRLLWTALKPYSFVKTRKKNKIIQSNHIQSHFRSILGLNYHINDLIN